MAASPVASPRARPARARAGRLAPARIAPVEFRFVDDGGYVDKAASVRREAEA
jgi:hypothetical protein